MTSQLVWERDGGDWPNRETSRFVETRRLRWHVQLTGSGPVLLLVHGTGAATHSWRDMLPPLAEHFTVIAPDLPGHGFTELPPPHRLSLPAMADALAELLDVLELSPELAVGHSAGAAILVRMCLDGRIAPAALVSLSGALLPLPGLQGHLFSPVARLLALTSLTPRLVAWSARDPAMVDRLLAGTGSRLDARGFDLYARLARDRGQIAGALGMMANWELRDLEAELAHLETPLVLVAADRDRMISPGHARRIRRLLPQAEVVRMPDLGHLAHEERPADAVAIVLDVARAKGILSAERPAAKAAAGVRAGSRARSAS
jgi:magnesium chelatase accessory protein